VGSRSTRTRIERERLQLGGERAELDDGSGAARRDGASVVSYGGDEVHRSCLYCKRLVRVTRGRRTA